MANEIKDLVSDIAEKTAEEVNNLNGTVDSISAKLGDELVNFSQIKKTEQQISAVKKSLLEVVIKELLTSDALKSDYFKKSVSSSINKIPTVFTRTDKEDLNGNLTPGFVRALVADIVVLKNILSLAGKHEIDSILLEYGVKIEDKAFAPIIMEETKSKVEELLDTLVNLTDQLTQSKEELTKKVFSFIPDSLKATPVNRKGITPQQAFKLMEVKAISKVNPAKSADVTSKILDDSLSSSESALLFASLAGTVVANAEEEK